MNSLKHLPEPNRSLQPEDLDYFFSPEQQRTYISLLLGRVGLTRRRAECFVRLWAYLLLKQRQELGAETVQPLVQLQLPQGLIACSHRESAALFYGQRDRGSDRAAGMMIDCLAELGLIEKRFDGQMLSLRVCSLPELASATSKAEGSSKLKPDVFNPRTDAIPAANLIARTYAELIQVNRSLSDPLAVSHKIARVLRIWSQQYPNGLRVLRRCDNHNPVALAICYPTANESEINFFQPLSKTFYLTAETEVDAFKMATVGDPSCTAVYIRAWTIDASYANRATIRLLLEDTQQTLSQMRADFPGLCDLYSALVQPSYEELRLALGFQKISQDSQRSYSWLYLALDHFLNLDLEQALTKVKSGLGSE